MHTAERDITCGIPGVCVCDMYIYISKQSTNYIYIPYPMHDLKEFILRDGVL